MGQLHNEIRSGPLSDAVTRALGVTRQGGVERFSETIQPTLDPYMEGEWNYLRQEALWSFVKFQAAVAAELSMLAVVNPLNSGLIVTVDRCQARGTSVNTCQMGTTTRTVIAATLTLGNPALMRDTRWAKGSPFAVQIVTPIESWSGSDPLSLDSIFEETGPLANYNPCISLPVILKPGAGYFVQGGTVNLGIGAAWAGRYRKAFPGELT